MFKIDKTPIDVIVSADRWDCYGSPTSWRQRWLFAMLKYQGGISDSVPPGHYLYNVEWRGFYLYPTLHRVAE